MERQRAQGIIIQNMKVLFGEGKIRENYFGHFFIGGGVEINETPEEAVLREIEEEANIKGIIVFKIEEPSKNHHTYLIDIGKQTPVLGYDPEEEEKKRDFCDRSLQGLEYISLYDAQKFTLIDIDYFELLLKECDVRHYYSEWYNQMKIIVKEKSNR